MNDERDLAREQAISNLSLMLMYLTSWTERRGEFRRCWKGYDFDILDQLVDAGLISTSHGAKSAYLTEDGERRAVQLIKAYGIPSDLE